MHDALILFAFTLVLGFVLGLVYGITKDPIEAADLAASQAAYQQVFSDAESFAEYEEFDKESAASLMEKAATVMISMVSRWPKTAAAMISAM